MRCRLGGGRRRLGAGVGAGGLPAAAAVTAVSVTASGASTAGPRALPGLHAPDLHVRTAAAAGPADACGYHAAIPADRLQGIPVFNPAQAAQPFDVKFHTTQGIITVRMLTDAAPCTTFSFRFLTSGGYFNKTHCHRLTIQGIFVLQCGDPAGTSSGGPGYAFNYGYGTSEEIVGRATRAYTRREDVVLATKVFFKMHDGPGGSGLSRRAIIEQLDDSLCGLGTDYVDLYQIHRFDPATPVEEPWRPCTTWSRPARSATSAGGQFQAQPDDDQNIVMVGRAQHDGRPVGHVAWAPSRQGGLERSRR